MANWMNFLGTTITKWRIGLLGPTLKNNSNAALEVRDATDSAFLPVRGADPNSEDSFTTKRWVDSQKSVVKITNQANCSVSLGSNTGSVGYYVVTTAGNGAVIGDLLYDNGSAVGLRSIIPAAVRVISIPFALSGGTITFDPDSIYLWDVEGNAWIKVGDIGSVTGSVRACRWALNAGSASQASAFSMPANARVIAAILEITTPYNGGVTIALGITGTPAAFLATGDNNAQVADRYKNEQDTSIGASPAAGLATLSGTLSSGAGVATLLFTVPN